MKLVKQIIIGCSLLTFGYVSAQNPDREISEETTEKRYEMYEDGKLVKKSVKIHTSIKQDIKFAEEDEGKVDARRIQTPKTITKTVNIDNDADEYYDEVIKFTYTSKASKDFLVDTNDAEIFKALENSRYLNIDQDENMSEKNLNTLFVITDKDGKVLDLVLDHHKPIE